MRLAHGALYPWLGPECWNFSEDCHILLAVFFAKTRPIKAVRFEAVI